MFFVTQKVIAPSRIELDYAMNLCFTSTPHTAAVLAGIAAIDARKYSERALT